MRRGGGGGGGSKGGVGEAFQLTERLLLWTVREGILNIWFAGRGRRRRTSSEFIYRCLVDNCLEFFQVSACVNLVLVGNIVNLDKKGSRQVQTVPQ